MKPSRPVEEALHRPVAAWHLNSQIEAFTGHNLVRVRPTGQCSAGSTGGNEELYVSNFGLQFISAPSTGDDVPREPLPRHRGRRRSALLGRADQHRRHQAFIQYFAPVHPAAHPAGCVANVLQSGIALARAGLRAPRRRRAEPRPRRAAHRDHPQVASSSTVSSRTTRPAR